LQIIDNQPLGALILDLSMPGVSGQEIFNKGA